MSEATKKRTLRERWKAFYRKHHTMFLLALMVVSFMVIFLSRQMLVTVPAGHGGVMWWRFFGGTATTWHYGEGTHLIPPWDTVQLYDLRLQTLPLNVSALVSDGLVVDVEVAVQFRLNPETIGMLHQDVGPQYLQTLIIPQISAHVRNVVATVSAESLYSQGRQLLQEAIEQDSTAGIDKADDGHVHGDDFIELEHVLIRRVNLPDDVRTAIADKNVALHNAEQYDYLIEQERKETVRKIIEAIGIRTFQEIVSQGITDSYLRWKGIEATENLASSNNAKMVIIGAGDEGMPIILGNWDSTPVPAETPDPTAGTGGAPPDDSSADTNDQTDSPAPAPGDSSSLPQENPLSWLLNDATGDPSRGEQFLQDIIESVDNLSSQTQDKVDTMSTVIESEFNTGTGDDSTSSR